MCAGNPLRQVGCSMILEETVAFESATIFPQKGSFVRTCCILCGTQMTRNGMERTGQQVDGLTVWMAKGHIWPSGARECVRIKSGELQPLSAFKSLRELISINLTMT